MLHYDYSLIAKVLLAFLVMIIIILLKQIFKNDNYKSIVVPF